MNKKANLKFIEEMLGEDFLSSLTKAELYKPETGSTVDHAELADALQIVPKTVMAWLTRVLGDMQRGENKVIDLPFSKASGAQMHVSKMSNDVYHGEFVKAGQVAYRFKYRSIPGIGLALLSTFELYDQDALKDESHEAKEKMEYLSAKIAEQVALRSLVSQVIDEKMAQRDAIDQLIKLRMNSEIKKEMINPTQEEAKDHSTAELVQVPKPRNKAAQLKEFLENRKIEKKEKDAYTVHLAKSGTVKCPDCRQTIFNGDAITGCVCYGADRNRKVFLKKSEDGKISIKFSKGWEKDNIEMLLEVLRSKK